MKKTAAIIIVLSLLLGGCRSWMNGSYVAVAPHTEPYNQKEKPVLNASTDVQLKEALITLVDSSEENGVIYLQGTLGKSIDDKLEAIVNEVAEKHPLAVYAVEKIQCETGAVGGKDAVSVHITYQSNRQHKDKIRRIQDAQQIKQIILEQLEACETGVVMIFDNQNQVDFTQLVADCATEYPQKVMKIPEVTVSRYPEEGQIQIVEVKLAYGSSYEELRTLQNRVTPVFQAAAQYVTGQWADEEKAARLYKFLMGRYDYNIQTSVTPAYSLLLHGEGDHQAFATVYAAMCRQSNVDCQVVTGTRGGEPWVWNVLCIDEVYYYIDLLQCKEEGDFHMRTQNEMAGYVWDDSAYQFPVEENY